MPERHATARKTAGRRRYGSEAAYFPQRLVALGRHIVPGKSPKTIIGLIYVRKSGAGRKAHATVANYSIFFWNSQ